MIIMVNDKMAASAYPEDSRQRAFGHDVQVPTPEPVPAKTHRANEEQRVKQARDRAQYVRQQKGHSWIVWWLLLGPVTLWIPAVYYSFSPNHYWHI